MNKAVGATDTVVLNTGRCERLVLHRFAAPAGTSSGDPGRRPVILAHGTLSNHRSVASLARYLNAAGHECWLIDYEGHGASAAGRDEPDFDSLFDSGTQAALHHIVGLRGRAIHWVGHSGGGLAPLISIARDPSLAGSLASLVMLGSQAAGAGEGVLKRAALVLSEFGTTMLGRVPAGLFGIGPEGEYARVMRQWFRWNLQRRWIGTDGIDYVSELSANTQFRRVPRLAMAGSGDWYIAPPRACRALHESLPGDNRQWLECGRGFGFLENYSHARLVASRSAAQEIWPRVAQWLADAESCRQP